MHDEWQTPDDLFIALDKQFDFDIDLCANENNTKCKAWVDDIEKAWKEDLLIQDYQYFMNPPYSRGNIGKCMKIACKLGYEHGITVVCLVRFDPSAKWFQRYVDNKATEVRMLDRRVKFKGAPSAYNFPCCVVVYDWGQMTPRGTEYFLWGW